MTVMVPRLASGNNAVAVTGLVPLNASRHSRVR